MHWQNHVPKAERLQSLQAHLEALLHRVARTDEWRRIPLRPLCREVERRAEAAFPGESEERVSARCHRRLRKLGNALRCGWELELLGGGRGDEVDCSSLLTRLDTLGPAKQSNYMHIKAGDRDRQRILMEVAGGRNGGTTPAQYGNAVMAQRTTVWHQEGTAAVVAVLREARAARVLDIGSSFDPLQGEFPEVAALDLLPMKPSVLQADFLEVDIVDGLTAVRTDPLEPGICAGVPQNLYDGAVLSHVLRSLDTVAARRAMVRRAALTLRPGGLLVVVERSALGSLLKYRGPLDTPWRDAGLERQAAVVVARGVVVNVFARAGSGVDAPGADGAPARASPRASPTVAGGCSAQSPA